MKKVLVLTSVASMIDQFNMPFIELLQKMGFSVDVACNFTQGNTCSDKKIEQLQNRLSEISVNYYQIDFARSITAFGQNIRAYKQVKKLVNEKKYSFIHCHSPIGGVVGRIVGCQAKTKVIYTAHGFHFYKGSPLINWLLYYSIEKICSRWTDVLITINNEDYALAQKKMKAKLVEYIPGVGVDLSKFCLCAVDKKSKRASFGIPEDSTLLLSIGELNQNKNHETVIRAIQGMDVYYIIAGQGDLLEHLTKVVDEVGMTDRVKFLGFRTDIKELYLVSDIFVLPSFREGLSLSIMEAMACGMPIVCSKIRGNVDLVNEKGGALFNPYSVGECRDSLNSLLLRPSLDSLRNRNIEKIKQFGKKFVLEKMANIYHLM